MIFQALLTAPEPDDPQDAVVARQYKSNPDMFRRTAEHWAAVYAGSASSNPDFASKMRKLREMGVEEEAARAALSSCDWDLDAATHKIFS